jgi:hypothetical protein
MEMLMEPRKPEDNLAILRAANKHLRLVLIRLRPEQQHCSSIKPEDLSDLRTEIQRAADCVQGASLAPQASELRNESLEYRRNLEQLKHLLPDLQIRLLAEKSRLEGEKKHVAAAAAWAGASATVL